MIEVVVKTAAGRIPVIAGAGSNNTDQSIRLMRFAKKVGADAALVVTPYYNKPSQRGLYHHYKTLHDAVELPIIIYNIPGRSVVDMTPGDHGRARPAAAHRRRQGRDRRRRAGSPTPASPAGADFIQLSGEDASALGFNAHGGVGCISVVANIAPRLCAEFQEAMLAGDFARALELPGPADAAAPRRLRRAEPGPDQVRAVAARQAAPTRCARRW